MMYVYMHTFWFECLSATRVVKKQHHVKSFYQVGKLLSYLKPRIVQSFQFDQIENDAIQL